MAGGQVGDEFAVGEEEIVIGEFTGEDPGDLLECAGSDFRLGVLGGEEMDFEVLGRIGVPVADAGDGGGFNESDAEFFAEFAREGLLEGFAGANFAAGEFPLECRGVAATALADKDAAIGTFNYGCYDLDHD